MAKMKVAQVPKAGGDFEILEREIPSPGAGQVLIKVQACGICFSDHLLKDGLWPGLQFPRVPGHEVAGVIDQIGSGVTAWKKGDRVGVGWHGGQDNTCPACRAGDFANCEKGAITGFNFDGGYEEYMIAPIEAVARIPDGLNAPEAAPLLCAGITTFNALRHSGAGPGDLVAVQGIGGLGRNGTLLVVGADMAPLEIPGAALIAGRKRIQGWASGTPSDSEDTLRFAALHGVRPMIEKFPLEKAAEAYARMTSGNAQFRVVLTM